jgi:hypothetical protein
MYSGECGTVSTIGQIRKCWKNDCSTYSVFLPLFNNNFKLLFSGLQDTTVLYRTIRSFLANPVSAMTIPSNSKGFQRSQRNPSSFRLPAYLVNAGCSAGSRVLSSIESPQKVRILWLDSLYK